MNKLSFYFVLTAFSFGALACSKQDMAPVISGFNTSKHTQTAIYTPTTEQEEKYAPQGTRTLYHVVKRGDNLWDIAQLYDTTTGEIIKNNALKNSMVQIGQRLKIKETSDVAASNFSGQKQSKFTDRIAQKETVQAQPDNQKLRAQSTPNETTPKPNQEVSQRLHRVRSGENLFRIGLKYNVSALDIMAMNDINKPEDLQAGAVITVPVVSDTETMEGTKQERSVNQELALKRGFIWPAQGQVINKFGRKNDGIVNNGIKIKLAPQAPVHAAEDGKVIYADDGLKTYGNLILLRHDNGLITAYAHLDNKLVRKGEQVKKGEVIAHAGQTGRDGEAQLHFEVRRNARAIDPLKILPNG